MRKYQSLSILILQAHTLTSQLTFVDADAPTSQFTGGYSTSCGIVVLVPYLWCRGLCGRSRQQPAIAKIREPASERSLPLQEVVKVNADWGDSLAAEMREVQVMLGAAIVILCCPQGASNSQGCSAAQSNTAFCSAASEA